MRRIITTLLVLFVFCAQAQKEGFNWHFGRKMGLNFNNSPPSTSPSNIDSFEGCSSISNKNGELLFYSNGVEVWSRDHQIMPNGAGLMGAQTMTMGSLILPLPGSSNIYYLFTLYGFKLYYSIIDMSLNGGLGDVTSQKNVLLSNSASEKLLAIRHDNPSKYWILSHEYETNVFQAFEFSSSGINTTPVESDLGVVARYIHGYMACNPQGNKVAVAWVHHKLFQIFGFDNLTGVLSLEHTINAKLPYGLAFSPSGDKLYLSETDYELQKMWISQYSLSSNLSTAQLIQSKTILEEYSGYTDAGALMLAPNGKIYYAQSTDNVNGRDNNYLGAIHYPDVLGIKCYFQKDVVEYNKFTISIGLPNIPSNYLLFSHQGVCLGDTTYFHTYTQITDSLRWTFGDPLSGTQDTAYGVNSWHQYSSTGIYDATLIFYDPLFSDTIRFEVEVVEVVADLGADTSICTTPLTLSNRINYANAKFIWSDSSISSVLEVDDSGEYWLEVNYHGCVARDSIDVKVINVPPVDLGNDTSLCYGDSIVLGTDNIYESYLWNNGSADTTLLVKTSGWYQLKTWFLGCTASDWIRVIVRDEVLVDLGKDTAVCDTPLVLVNRYNYNDAKYTWNDSSTSNTLNIDTTGTYWLEVNRYECEERDSIHVKITIVPPIGFPEDTMICDGNAFALMPDNSYETYLWQDGSIEPQYWVSESGTYTLEVEISDCSISDAIDVAFYRLETIRLRDDTILCLGDKMLLDATTQQEANHLWQDGETTPVYVADRPGMYYVIVSTACEVLMDSVMFDCDCELYLPNSFTPNNDGLNDVYGPKANCEFDFYQMQIFNRWGEAIFVSRDINVGWAGDKIFEDNVVSVYIASLTYKYKNRPEYCKENIRVTLVGPKSY